MRRVSGLYLLAICAAPFCAIAADEPAPLLKQVVSLPARDAVAVLPPASTRAAPAFRLARANFEREHTTHEAREVADWIVHSGDSRGMPFVIVDKKDAKVFVFDAHGKLRGATPALLGLAHGDDAVPGIGRRALSGIRPEERTTPAGRFVAAMGRNLKGVDILWVDYDTAISMHAVVTSNRAERRLQRLATPTSLDNRISYGCINVPAKFFTSVLHPTFAGTSGIVYVLPETRSASKVFASYSVDEQMRSEVVSHPAPIQLASGAERL